MYLKHKALHKVNITAMLPIDKTQKWQYERIVFLITYFNTSPKSKYTKRNVIWGQYTYKIQFNTTH